MGGPAHLARRFVGSLLTRGPSAEDDDWARSHLLEGERRLWDQLPRADRAHAVGVARRVIGLLPEDQVARPVLAAALLHDVGKLDSALGTWGRVGATLAALVAGRDMATSWSMGRGFTRRVGLYLRHDELGSQRLAVAGSDPLTVGWAGDHHLPEERWQLEPHLGRALKQADDD